MASVVLVVGVDTIEASKNLGAERIMPHAPQSAWPSLGSRVPP